MLLNILVYTLLSCTFCPILFPHDLKFTTRDGKDYSLFINTIFCKRNSLPISDFSKNK